MSGRRRSGHHGGHNLTESLLLVLLGGLFGFLGFVSALSSDSVDGLVGLVGDTLDESGGVLLAHLLDKLFLDEDRGELDGSSSSHLTLLHGVSLVLAGVDGFLGDLVGDFASDSLELLEGVVLLSVFSLGHDDDSGSSSGSFDVLDDFSSSLLAEFLGEMGLHLLHDFLDSNLSGLSGLLLGVLGSLTLFVDSLLDRFLSSLSGNFLHLSDDLSDSLGLGLLGLFGGFDNRLFAGDTVRELLLLDSNHLVFLGDDDGLLSAERSAVGTGDLGLNLLKKSGREFALGVSENISHGVNRGSEGSVGLIDLLLEGESVGSDSDFSPLGVLPGLAAHSEDVCESALVVFSGFGDLMVDLHRLLG